MKLDALIESLKGSCREWTPASEQYVRNLYGFARMAGASIIMEVGVGPEAVSAQTFAAAIREIGRFDPLLVSIDIDAEKPTREQFNRVNRTVEWHVIHRDSTAFAHSKPDWTPEDVDLVYIDGDHSLEAMRSDYEMLSPLLKPGGMAVFDDVTGPILGLEGSFHQYDADNGNGHFVWIKPPKSTH